MNWPPACAQWSKSTIKEEEITRGKVDSICVGFSFSKVLGRDFPFPKIFPMFFFFSMLLLSFLIQTPKRIEKEKTDSLQGGPLLVTNGVILVILVMLESLKIVCPI